VALSLAAPRAEQLAEVADHVQEWEITELAAAGRPTNWPPCPAHPDNHPLSAAVRDSTAVWVCPTDGRAVRPIGGADE
jgi:hypothetical protein